MTSEMELVVDAGGGVQCVYGEELDLLGFGRLQITQADLAALTERVRRRVIRWFRLRRLLAARRPTGATWCRRTMSVPETAFGNRETGIRGSRAAHHLKNAEDVPLTALTSAGTPSVPRSLGRPGR